jgi:23S rRNA (cytosine1962-C5)-methyltransferase
VPVAGGARGAPGDSEPARIRLAPGRERPLRDGHPWLFDGAIAEETGPPDAALARIETAAGESLGLAFYAPGSRLRARLLGPDVERVDRAFFARRLDAALELRRRVVPPATDGYRVVNAEGDLLPGWTVDRFGEVLVSQITVAGLERLRGEAYAALAERFPDCAVLHAGDLAARRVERLPLADEWIRGTARTEARFLERGLVHYAELAGGQKTGFYCDQRDHRRRVEELAAERSLLDLFAHGAAFSLAALRGGARRAVAVESTARLLATARRQIEENRLDAAEIDLVEADVFDFLRRTRGGERFELVVCDPPPFARRRAEIERAARAYKDLNRLALERVAPGGFLFTFSCSGAVDAKLFRQILYAAAAEAGVALQLLAPLGAAPDHPVALAHPEGEYLKGWWARVARGAPAR